MNLGLANALPLLHVHVLDCLDLSMFLGVALVSNPTLILTLEVRSHHLRVACRENNCATSVTVRGLRMRYMRHGVCLLGFVMSSSTTRLYRGRASRQSV